MPPDPKPKASNVADLVGNTPLLRLDRIAKDVVPSVELYAKAEWDNPGGSVKDRAALYMLREAMQRGLTPAKVILDATSGNTGIALAMLGAAEGFRITLCVPKNLSPERRRILRAFGAELVFTPAAEGTDGAQRVAKAMAAGAPDRYWYFDQYNNEANWRAHFETTGPEILDQTRGRITHFVACLGTTGTFVGVGRHFRKVGARVRMIAVQPESPFHGIEGVKHLETATRPGIWDPSLADEFITVATEDAQRMALRLAREEGYLVGTSSGAAMDAALRLAERIREGVIVMVFPDAGDKYLGERYWEEAL
ncbi:MAG TPA: PLP-dependent cysteine synthase family protein [Thermoplasmata archaeon]|jgi:cysteine synthase B